MTAQGLDCQWWVFAGAGANGVQIRYWGGGLHPRASHARPWDGQQVGRGRESGTNDWHGHGSKDAARETTLDTLVPQR